MSDNSPLPPPGFVNGVSPKSLGVMPNTPSKPAGDQGEGTRIGPGSPAWNRGLAPAREGRSIPVGGMGGKPKGE